VPHPLVNPDAVFLNIPYDESFGILYTAYIVGLCQLGLVPRLASEISGGERRLDKILALIKSCRYSIHDMSNVYLSRTEPQTPRFNMPLELGLTITWAKIQPARHTWFVWESEPYRLQKSMSDLNGTDPHIHHGTVEGVMAELRSAFVFRDAPAVPDMMKAYRIMARKQAQVLATSRSPDLYSAAVFKDLCFIALDAARNTTPKSKS